jgi:hypothetical protein
MRTVILGGPGTGKTTRAERLRQETGLVPRGTDELMQLPWSDQSDAVADWLLSPDPYTIEGVAAVRGLRKALERTAGKPCDRVVWLTKQHRALETKGAQSMAKAVTTIWSQIRDDLAARGVEIVEE